MGARRGMCLWLLVLQGLCCQWWSCAATSTHEFKQTVLEGTQSVVLQCKSEDTGILSITIEEANTSTKLIVLLRKDGTNNCFVYKGFASCTFGSPDYSARVIPTDLKETTEYVCEIRRWGEQYEINTTTLPLSATPMPPTTQSADTPSTETTTQKESANVANSSAQGGNGGFPSAVAYAILVVLVIVMVVCCVLGFKFYSQRRRKRKSKAVDPDTISNRSAVTDKSFYYAPQGTLSRPGGGMSGRGRGGVMDMDMGMGMGMGMDMGMGMVPDHCRTLSSSSHQAPMTPAPQTPGGQRLVMDYQRPFNALPVHSHTLSRTTDARRMSETAVQYQEPWCSMPPSSRTPGLSTSSTLQRYPNPRLVRIPDFDTTATAATTTTPSPPSSPAEASPTTSMKASMDPPTQETGAASLEDGTI